MVSINDAETLELPTVKGTIFTDTNGKIYLVTENGHHYQVLDTICPGNGKKAIGVISDISVDNPGISNFMGAVTDVNEC